MLEQFVVTFLMMTGAVAFGMFVAGWVNPIAWKFPGYDRQVLVQKMTGWYVIVCCFLFVVKEFWLFVL